MKKIIAALAVAVGLSVATPGVAQADSTTRVTHMVQSERSYLSVRLTTGAVKSVARNTTVSSASQVYNPSGCWLVIHVYNNGVFQYCIETQTAGWRSVPGLRHNYVRLDCP
jgi:hypothetical protein